MPLPFADAARIFQISRPSQSQRAPFKVAKREHVGQTEWLIVPFAEFFEELDDLEVPEVRVVDPARRVVHLDPLDHEGNPVRSPVPVEIRDAVDFIDTLNVAGHHVYGGLFWAQVTVE